MKSKLILLGIAIVVLGLTQGCGLLKGNLKFEKAADELQSSDQVATFIQSNQAPSIVIRIADYRNDSLNDPENNYYLYLMEKELVRNGFHVKDYGLFNEMLEKIDIKDYKNLKSMTGIDLILELERVDRDVLYTTNRFYTNKGEERILNDFTVNRLGATAQFKLIMVGNNEVVGTYKFNYTPCSSGNEIDCHCQLGYKNVTNKIYPHINLCKSSRTHPETILMDDEQLEVFFVECVQGIVNDLKGE